MSWRTEIDWKTAKVEFESRGDRLVKIVNGRTYGWYEPRFDGEFYTYVWWFA